MLTSSVEDGLQRRFSVSASMDEISKVGLTSSPSGLGPEQAALAQSQHFDQLEALWNKQSPPARPRAHGRTLSKQSSLQATRISDSEEEGKIFIRNFNDKNCINFISYIIFNIFFRCTRLKQCISLESKRTKILIVVPSSLSTVFQRSKG